ncbi:MAG: VCBS repeat-containing protein, partial [FCB group bacterium]|nr:VCBS repeat-containing protein [FCB group bacterium]
MQSDNQNRPGRHPRIRRIYGCDENGDSLCSGRDFTPPNYLLRAFLYENNGDGTFTKITNTGVVPVENGKIGWIDYDKDGYMDLIVYGFSSSGRITKIYHNNSGNGTFTDINAGLPGVCQGDFSWADYDSDGYPDFIMTGQASDNSGITKLYHNNGSGGFNEVSCAILNFSSSSLSWVDFNNDGRPDIFIEGYSGGWKTKLYRNDGLNSNGEPQFIPVETNIQPLGDGRNAWGDYDNDGDLDLVFSGGGVGGYPVANDVYRNDGVGTQSNSWVFTKLNANLIPSHIGATNDAWSVGWGDYDNDGDLDILMTGLAGFNSKYSVVYRNDGPVGPGNQWVFTDINAGLQPISWGNTVWGDYDNDGDLDIAMSGTKSSSGCGSTIAVAKLYRNNLGSNVPVLNTIPDAPLAATLDAVVSGSNVTLSWGNGSDYQTPVNGLYYNIVVGTTANPLSVISPMAEVPGGYRHTPTIGTQNQNLSWEVKNLPAGTYD